MRLGARVFATQLRKKKKQKTVTNFTLKVNKVKDERCRIKSVHLLSLTHTHTHHTRSKKREEEMY